MAMKWVLQISSNFRLFNVISGHSLRESYLFAEMQTVYSTTPTDLAGYFKTNFDIYFFCKHPIIRVVTEAAVGAIAPMRRTSFTLKAAIFLE